MTDPTTYGDLKRLVATMSRGEWPSRVNAGLTRSQAIDIFIAALQTHPDEQLITATRQGCLLARNVINEMKESAS